MNLKLRFLAIIIIGLCLSAQGLLAQNDEEFIKTDPTVYRTGLLMQKPEIDSQAVEGSRFLGVRGIIDPSAKIAASYFNYDYLPPVNSQGAQGSCAAWAVGYYYKSYQENRENSRTDLGERSDPHNICSPAFIYNLIHVKDDGGAYFSDAFRMINDFGCPSLVDMSYNHTDYQTWPDESDFENAIPCRTQTTGGEYYYLKLDSDSKLDQVKLMLQNGQLAVFGIYVFYNYDHISSYNNVYTIADQSGDNRGGHAQTIVGYDDDLVTNDGVGAFRVVNSWGTSWGDSGYYWISYEAIKFGSGISQGYIYWVDDKSDYSSDKAAIFQFSHDYSRETSTWIYVGGASKYFFDFAVKSLDREYRSFPNSNIVLDIKDLDVYLTDGEELRLYMSDALINGVAGVIESFNYEDKTLNIELSSGDTPVTIADGTQGYASITIPPSNVPEITLNKYEVTFGAQVGGSNPPEHEFTISNTGEGTMNWSVSDNKSWLSCWPGSGTDSGTVTVDVDISGLSAGSYTGTVTVSSDEAYNSPQYLDITLNVYSHGADSSPFGSFDAPVSGSTVSGNIPVTGWALDDIRVTKVEIKRNSHPDDNPAAIGPDGLVYIGDAVFVKGARPDVEAAYPSYPNCNKAGWGYMMLTNFLPNNGSGDFRIYAFAYDDSGHKVELGSKNITCDNANRIKPFGTIDTPAQGGVASGTAFANFGWALTPPPKLIPTNGSTIWVFINGVPKGHPTYNLYREDIASLFPGYLNSDGAVGLYYIDTTQYSNGVHNIAWSVADDEGAIDGIGSRYFEIQNGGEVSVSVVHRDPVPNRLDTSGRLQIKVKMKEVGKRPDRFRAFDQDQMEDESESGFWHTAYNTEPLRIEIEELERIVLRLEKSSWGKLIGWGMEKSRSLPVGSTLDDEKGLFYWMPGPGFLGRHVLHFAVSDGTCRGMPVRVIVDIKPKTFK